MPVIAFDFDGTITEDVKLFRRAMCLFKDAGWTVLVCTGRNDSSGNVTEVLSAIRGLAVEVVFAGGVNKREACRKRGYPKVQVWVDDCPAMVDGAIPLLSPNSG